MIIWNYKDTDPEFGNWQAKELTSHLEHVFCNLPIEILHGKKCLEVVPSQLKKVLNIEIKPMLGETSEVITRIFGQEIPIRLCFIYW